MAKLIARNFERKTNNFTLPTVVEEDEDEDNVETHLAEPPMIVHCSAGIGRTGVLIVAETALEYTARRQPLYPLDLVRAMRRQMPMSIQNVSQYKFVCASIQAAYAQMKQGLNSSESGSNFYLFILLTPIVIVP